MISENESSQLNFFVYKKRKRTDNTVWNHFLREENGQYAKCNFKDCNKVLKNSGSTSALHKHLKAIHSIILEKENNGFDEVEKGMYILIFKYNFYFFIFN
jgi:hypothetical protein